MEYFLDRIASSTLISMSLYLVLILGGILIGLFLNPFKKTKLRIAYMFVIIGFTLIPMFLTSHKGLVDNVLAFKIIQNKICLVDFNYYASDNGDYSVSRINVVDTKTGEKLNRTYLGENIIWLDNQNNLILFQDYDRYVVYDIQKMEIVREIDFDYLTENFPELSIGIESITANKNCFNILAKNGKSYIYDAYANKTNVPCKASETEKNNINYYYTDILSYYENGTEIQLFKFEAKNPNDLLKYIKTIPNSENQTVLTSKESFIEGTFLKVFFDKKLFLLKSYETTDKTNFIITALNFDLETIWKLDYSTLNPKDFYSENYKLFDEIYENDNNIYFAIGGFVYCVETETGKIVWKNRL